MAVTFEKNLRFLQYLDPDKPVLIHQHCDGGSFNDGLAIYDAIKASTCHITMLVYSQASSMSSIILQAADLRILMPSCEFLVHFGGGELEGVVDAVLSGADRWRDLKNHLLRIYAERMQKSNLFKERNIDEIIKYLEEKLNKVTDWYLSADGAVKFGFADHILGNVPYKQINDLL
jgi:ATP-dependent Clp protease protease subunit